MSAADRNDHIPAVVHSSHFSNGRVVHYNGASLLQWRSIRLDIPALSTNDVIGIGWEKTSEQGGSATAPVRGRVYFTFNGRRLTASIEEVSGGLWPVVHLQKRVRYISNILLIFRSSFCYFCLTSCLFPAHSRQRQLWLTSVPVHRR